MRKIQGYIRIVTGFLHCCETRCIDLFHWATVRLETQPRPLAIAIVGFASWVISGLLYTLHFFPDILRHWTQTRAADVVRMAANPLTRELNEPIMAYRVLLPTLGWLLGLPGRTVLILPYVALIVALGLVYYLFARRGEGEVGIILSAGLGCTQFAIWTNSLPGFADPLTLLASCACLLTSNGAAAATLGLLGTLNDERFVFAIPFILLWHLTVEGRGRAKTIQLAAWYGLGLGVVLCVRHALTVGWVGPGIVQPQEYGKIQDRAVNFLAFLISHPFWLGTNYFMSFRFFWILIPVGYLAGRSMGVKTMERALYLSSLVGVLAASALVWDVSRSVRFAFPALLLAVSWLYRTNPGRALRLLLVALVLCLLTPAFYVGADGLQPYLPLPFVVIKAATGWDVLDLIRTPGKGRFGVSGAQVSP